MTSYTYNSRRRLVLLAAAIVLGINQLGRIPVPPKYCTQEQQSYVTASARAHTQAPNADVIVMGNSRAMLGIDSTELARDVRIPGLRGRTATVTNLTAPAMTPAGDLWLWRALKADPQGPRARLVIIGLAPIDFTTRSPGNDFVLRYLYRMPDVVWLAREGRENAAATLLTYQVLPLYALRTSLMNLVSRRFPRGSVDAPPSPQRDALWLSAFVGWYKDFAIDPWQAWCLQRAVAQMRQRRMHVVLFSAPVRKSLLRIEAGQKPGEPIIGPGALTGNPESPLQLFRALMERDFASRAGVTYLDYMHPDDSKGLEFRDPTHLRSASATVFTRRLAADVNRTLPSGEQEGRRENAQAAPARRT
jgi:hypothetical protein